MENGEDDELRAPGSRQYRPVVAHDPAVLQMSSMEPGSSSSFPDRELKNIKVSNPKSEVGEESHATLNGSERESKLELFGFDSLVNILGLKSMTGEQIQAPSSPRDGEDVSINLGRPQPSGLKLGTLMGVFVPCLQNIMGIIYYIRFSWNEKGEVVAACTGEALGHSVIRHELQGIEAALNLAKNNIAKLEDRLHCGILTYHNSTRSPLGPEGYS